MPAAAITGGAILGSAILGSNASKSASNAQKSAADQANATQQKMYDQTRQDLSGYRGAGNSALEQLMGYYGMGGQGVDYQKLLSGLPGYQFQMQSGTKAVDQNLAAKGLLQSGAAGKALTQYGQGLGQQYGQQYASGLMGIANLGENAAAQTGAIGANSAANQGANSVYAGNAQGQSDIGQAYQWQQGLQGLAGTYGDYQGQQYQQRQSQANSLYIDPTATYASNGTYTGLKGLT